MSRRPKTGEQKGVGKGVRKESLMDVRKRARSEIHSALRSEAGAKKRIGTGLRKDSLKDLQKASLTGLQLEQRT